MIKLLLVLSSFLISFSAFAQQPNTGKSTELGEKFKTKKDQSYNYEPVQAEFYADALEKLKIKRFEEVNDLVKKQRRTFGTESNEAQEAELIYSQMLVDMGLKQLGFQHYLALARKAHGSRFAEKALSEMITLSKITDIDEDALEAYLLYNDFANIHPDLNTFVASKKYIHHLRYNLASRWQAPLKEAVPADSYSGLHNTYLSTLSFILRKPKQNVLKNFENLKTQLETKELQKTQFYLRVMWQIARLHFERGEFEKAAEFYLKLDDLNLRDRARVLSERAWTYYYLNKYDKSLGLLAALRSPVFASANHFESLLLEMIIYKQLCHYDAVTAAIKEFRKQYSGLIKFFKLRRDLGRSTRLKQITFLSHRFQERANIVQELRTESELVRKYSWLKPKDKSKQLKEREIFLRLKLESEIEVDLPRIAEELLDVNEQVVYIEYTSRIDELSLNKNSKDRDFKTEEVSNLKFEKLYWPVQNEYWNDEMENYRVLIKSRCKDSSPVPSTTPQEENFL